jgi:hypothetical protein
MYDSYSLQSNEIQYAWVIQALLWLIQEFPSDMSPEPFFGWVSEKYKIDWPGINLRFMAVSMLSKWAEGFTLLLLT